MSEVRHDSGKSEVVTKYQELSQDAKRYYNVSSGNDALTLAGNIIY